jgi:hypothetical protein
MKSLKKIGLILLTLSLSIISKDAFSQGIPTDSLPRDPASIAVYTVQNIHFGAFTQGPVGGSVVLSPAGTRTATGDVILLNMGTTYYQSIFEIDAIVGTVISIMNGPDATLTGSNGGSMSMTIGSSSPGSPFVNSQHHQPDHGLYRGYFERWRSCIQSTRNLYGNFLCNIQPGINDNDKGSLHIKYLSGMLSFVRSENK